MRSSAHAGGGAKSYRDHMTVHDILRWASRWWATALAGIIFTGGTLFGSGTLFVLLLACAALGISRFWPRIALLVAAVAALGSVMSDVWSGVHPLYALITAFAAAVAIYNLEPARLRLWAAAYVVGIALLVATIAAALHNALQGWTDVGYAIPAFIGAVVVALVTWAVPFGIRAFRDASRAEGARGVVQARATVVEAELRDERLRADLTHDFHDVMAHSLAVLAAQAEGLRLTHAQHPERIEPVLTTISETARLALIEVRQLLERVDDDERRPQPTTVDIPALIDQTRSAGPRVLFVDTGRHGELTKVAEIAAYRIVQEALTNALRHGGSDIDVVVTLSWTGPGLSLSVSSPIADRDALQPIGRGITGMHERAKQAGGWLDVDAEGDTFVVTAYLPYQPIVQGNATAPLGEDALPTLPTATVLHDATAPSSPMAESAPAPAYPPRSWGEAARSVHLRGDEPA